MIKLLLHLIRHKRSPTQWTRVPVMIYPPVQTGPVKNVLTILQPPDLILSFKLIQTNSATLRQVTATTVSAGQILELDDGQDFPDQGS